MEEYFLVGFRVGQGQLGCSGRTTPVTQEEAGWNFFFFAEFESLLCEVFNVKHSTNFRSTNATHAPTIALQYSAIQKVQGHHYAQERGFFLLTTGEDGGKWLTHRRVIFQSVFLFTFFPLSLSLSGPARHPIKGTVAPATFLFLPPPILPGEGCMVEIGYSDSRDPFGLGGKGLPCDNWKLKRVSKYIISCSSFLLKSKVYLRAIERRIVMSGGSSKERNGKEHEIEALFPPSSLLGG